MTHEQVAANEASQGLPDVRSDDQRRSDLQVLPTLAECEQVIERGKRSFREVAAALTAIRDGRLYLETHATFEAYCRERWGFSRQRAHQLITAGAMSTTVDIQNEGQARRLRSVTEEETPTDQSSTDEWHELVRVMEQIDALTSSDASYLAATVPSHRRAATAKKLRKLGTYLGRIAWSLESEGEEQ